MADLGAQGGMANAHEARPILSGVPAEVGTTTAPANETHFGARTPGIGCSRRGAH